MKQTETIQNKKKTKPAQCDPPNPDLQRHVLGDEHVPPLGQDVEP